MVVNSPLQEGPLSRVCRKCECTLICRARFMWVTKLAQELRSSCVVKVVMIERLGQSVDLGECSLRPD